jgi:hypothetical protein
MLKLPYYRGGSTAMRDASAVASAQEAVFPIIGHRNVQQIRIYRLVGPCRKHVILSTGLRFRDHLVFRDTGHIEILRSRFKPEHLGEYAYLFEKVHVLDPVKVATQGGTLDKQLPMEMAEPPLSRPFTLARILVTVAIHMLVECLPLAFQASS